MISTTSKPSLSAIATNSADGACELIVYACPTGALAKQLVRYFEHTRAKFGPNAAHCYPPHITLTGFFHDTAESVPNYVRWLRESLERMSHRPDVGVQSMMLEQNFHGLLVESAWLKELVATFAAMAHSTTRLDAVRLKDWLHLSLAYEFAPLLHEPLKRVAQDLVDLQASVQWELCLYERIGDRWHCHAAWLLGARPYEHR